MTTKTSEKTNSKIIITRNDTIRTIYGGYGRTLEPEGNLGPFRYIRKGTFFTVISFNLYTQTILAVNQETKETFSLEYAYILENCRLIDPPKNKVIDAIAITNIAPIEEKDIDCSVPTLILAGLANILLLLLLLG